MNKLKSEGVCVFCNKTYTKAGITKHLKMHLNKKSNKVGTSFLLKVEAKLDTFTYFLFLWVDGMANLEDIDNLLRGVWLECCGHLSSFEDSSNKKEGFHNFSFDFDRDEEIGIPQNKKTKTVFYVGQKLNYEYDFGSSTQLLISVLEKYDIKADKRIVLLSRNEPLEIYCQACKKEPAVVLCSIEDWGADYLFCEKCSKKHAKTCLDFADYAALAIVNSPRMGVCAYEGGSKDTERDGVFKLRN